MTLSVSDVKKELLKSTRFTFRKESPIYLPDFYINRKKGFIYPKRIRVNLRSKRSFWLANHLAIFIINPFRKNYYCHFCHVKVEGFKLIKDPGCNKNFKLHAFGMKNNQCIMFNADHIIPRSKNGPDTIFNIRLSCNECNSKRGNNMTFKENIVSKIYFKLIPVLKMLNPVLSKYFQLKMVIIGRVMQFKTLLNKQKTVN